MRRKLIVAAIAALMILVVSVPNALAYFSTYVRIKGTAPLHLGEKVTFEEGPSEDGNKLITLTVDEDSDDVFVRVKAFAVKEVLDNLTYKDTSKWTESTEDDSRIYTYNTVLSAGDTVTLELIVDAEKTGLKEFNLVVVYEYCPAINGVPDWTGENIHIIEDADQNGGN